MGLCTNFSSLYVSIKWFKRRLKYMRLDPFVIRFVQCRPRALRKSSNYTPIVIRPFQQSSIVPVSKLQFSPSGKRCGYVPEQVRFQGIMNKRKRNPHPRLPVLPSQSTP